MYNCAHLRSTKESLTFEYDILWYDGQYGAELVDIHDVTGSLWCGTGWYLVVLGQYNLVLL